MHGLRVSKSELISDPIFRNYNTRPKIHAILACHAHVVPKALNHNPGLVSTPGHPAENRHKTRLKGRK